MNRKFFAYALAITIVTTVINWAGLVGASSRTGGSSWSSMSRGGYSGGYTGGGGHK